MKLKDYLKEKHPAILDEFLEQQKQHRREYQRQYMERIYSRKDPTDQ